jgi:hypothetical protein
MMLEMWRRVSFGARPVKKIPSYPKRGLGWRSRAKTGLEWL